MTRRTTHTLAQLNLTPLAYQEIAAKLREAGYDHAFDDDMIDMSGIGVVAAEAAPEVYDGKILIDREIEGERRIRILLPTVSVVKAITLTKEEALSLAELLYECARDEGIYAPKKEEKTE